MPAHPPAQPDDLTGDAVAPDATYEELTKLLEEVVEHLEDGNLPLDRALAEYERGVALVRRCNDLLDGAELKVSELSVDLGRGRSDTSPLAERLSLFDDLDDEPDEEE